MRTRLRRHEAARTAFLAVAALAALGLVAPLLAHWIPDAGRTIGIVALLGLGTILGAAVAYGAVIPARRLRQDERVARYVGRRQPEIASDLLSAVELGDTDTTRHSPHLVGALAASTADRVERLSPRELVPRSGLRRPARLAGGGVALYLAIALLAPSALADGWRALVAAPVPGPFGGAALSEQPLVGDIDIRLEYPLYARREPLRLPTSSGDFRAMPGTTVSISTRALEPVTGAQILFGGDEALEEDAEAGSRDPIAMTVEDRTLSAQFTVTEATEYRFLLVTEGGERRVEARPHTIEVDADEAPTVELYAPAEELDVTSLKRVELAYIAEDDYGIDEIALVWSQDGETERKELPVPEGFPRTAQNKFLWDLADVTLEPGVRVAYHIEVIDNDTVLGPNVGRSRELYLRVFSPRERHAQNITKQRELFEKMVENLGGRLVVATEDVPAHQVLHRASSEIVVELGTIVATLEDDELAAPDLRAALSSMRERLDGLLETEGGLLGTMRERAAAGKTVTRFEGKLGASDEALVTELEDDVVLLADWIERQQLEDVLATQDEIELHQKRLRELFEEYERTGDESLLAEIEREMKQLDKLLAEVSKKQRGLTEDVLDRFVNTEAMQADESRSCIDQARQLLKEGDAEAAQAKMEECMQAMDGAAQAMEQALSQLRGDKFTEQQRKLDGMMNDLADLTRDQENVADAADELWDRYADRADDMMRDKARQMRKELDGTIQKLRKKLGEVPEDGLTPFSQEELELVEKRLDDLERMLEDGDIAEALAMARQAEASLETMAAELQAAIEESTGPWKKRTRKASDGVEAALPLAEKLVEELREASPSPEQIMKPADRRALERLRRRQRANRRRADKVAEEAEKMADELPGKAGGAMSEGVRGAAQQMERAEDRMKARDPSGSRQEARGAAEKLRQAQKNARGAARQRRGTSRSGLRDEPVRIPGADEYEVPEKFREDILEAMKKQKAPEGFDDLVRRYYEELIR